MRTWTPGELEGRRASTRKILRGPRQRARNMRLGVVLCRAALLSVKNKIVVETRFQSHRKISNGPMEI